MQAAGAAHLFEFLLEPHDAFVDQPAVDLDLAFAGPAEEAETAALAFQVGPGPDQARALVGQMRQFDLQRAFLGGSAIAENLQDQARAVDHLGAPGPFQVALLHRGQSGIDDDDTDAVALARLLRRRDLAFAQQGGGTDGAQRLDGGVDDGQPDGGRQAHGLRQLRLHGAARVAAAESFVGENDGSPGRAAMRIDATGGALRRPRGLADRPSHAVRQDSPLVPG